MARRSLLCSRSGFCGFHLCILRGPQRWLSFQRSPCRLDRRCSSNCGLNFLAFLHQRWWKCAERVEDQLWVANTLHLFGKSWTDHWQMYLRFWSLASSSWWPSSSGKDISLIIPPALLLCVSSFGPELRAGSHRSILLVLSLGWDLQYVPAIDTEKSFKDFS